MWRCKKLISRGIPVIIAGTYDVKASNPSFGSQSGGDIEERRSREREIKREIKRWTH